VPVEARPGRDTKPDGSLPTRKELKAKAGVVAEGIEQALQLEHQGDATEANLRRVFSDILKRTEGKSLTSHTPQSLLDEWLAGRRAVVTRGTWSKYQQIRSNFLNHLGKRATAPLNSISKTDFIRFRDALLESGRSARTVNLFLTLLSGPFTLAFESGLISSNPLKGISRIKADHVEREVFTPEEVAALLKVASLEWQGVVLLGFFTGARLTDISTLCWGNIHLETRRIRFVAKKTGRPMEIPMHPELEKFLLQMPTSDDPRTFLFPTLAGRRTAGRGGLSNLFIGLMKKAGIAPGEARARKGEAGRSRSARSFHTLRHSFNSSLANLGVSQEIRQQLVGHASREVNDHYTHFRFQALREAVELVPRIGKLCAEPGPK
jgi:integrase